MRPTLYTYFDNKAEELLSQYKTSSGQNSSRNLGDNREIFINNFLLKVLPPKLSVANGEIWDKTGFKSGQIDTLITRDDAPALDFGGKNSYLAEGVFAVIEVKSNLGKDKLIEAGKTLIAIEKLQIPKPTVLMGGHNLERPLRIVFAYTGASWKNLGKIIDEKGWNDLFDLVCILDKGVLVRRGRLLFAYDKETNEKFEKDILLETPAACLGILYYYLVQYGVSFSTGSIQLEEYFSPIEKWGK